MTVLVFRPNLATGRMSLLTGLMAPLRIAGKALAGRWAMPDWSIANILGTIIPAANRWGRGKSE